MTSSQTVGILIFDDVEVLDFCGPFEVFSSARALGDGDNDPQLFKVITIAESNAIVRCRGGLQVQPDFTIENHPPLDIVVVPGGYGTRQVAQRPAVMAWIATQASAVSLTTSVCTGALLLASTGLLDGKHATTHWTAIDGLRQKHPQVTVEENVRFVDEGAIVTAAGVSAGIDMSLHVVARLHGNDVAQHVAREMEYDWRI